MIRTATKEEHRDIYLNVFKDNSYVGNYKAILNARPQAYYRNEVLVYEQDGKIIAATHSFQTYHYPKNNNVYLLNYLAVAVDFRGKGIGETLVKYIERVAINKKSFKVLTILDNKNEDGLRFFKKLGYKEASPMNKFQIRMEKEL